MQRFYTFMGSSTLPWERLWCTLWGMIPSPLVDGRLLAVLDDSINPKSGRKIFGCGFFHDHAAKGNQNTFPWSQCILMLGLLKPVKGRWACLPLSFCFYFMKADVDAALKDESIVNTRFKGEVVPFLTKLDQAAQMLKKLYSYFKVPVLVVADSWFGNNGLWSQLKASGGDFHLLSRLRTNSVLLGLPKPVRRESADVVVLANMENGLGRSRSWRLHYVNTPANIPWTSMADDVRWRPTLRW